MTCPFCGTPGRAPGITVYDCGTIGQYRSRACVIIETLKKPVDAWRIWQDLPDLRDTGEVCWTTQEAIARCVELNTGNREAHYCRKPYYATRDTDHGTT